MTQMPESLKDIIKLLAKIAVDKYFKEEQEKQAAAAELPRKKRRNAETNSVFTGDLSALYCAHRH